MKKIENLLSIEIFYSRIIVEEIKVRLYAKITEGGFAALEPESIL